VYDVLDGQPYIEFAVANKLDLTTALDPYSFPNFTKILYMYNGARYRYANGRTIKVFEYEND
jgi:hypothetical protein